MKVLNLLSVLSLDSKFRIIGKSFVHCDIVCNTLFTDVYPYLDFDVKSVSIDKGIDCPIFDIKVYDL